MTFTAETPRRREDAKDLFMFDKSERARLDNLTENIIGAAISVHRVLGPGLLESAYLVPVHEAQLLSYLKLANLIVGLLLNFHVPVLKNGLKRIVNNY